MRRALMTGVLGLVVAGLGLLWGCATAPDGSQALHLPNCHITSAGGFGCSTGGMSIPLPRSGP